MGAYAAACTLSVGTAVGLNKLVTRFPFKNHLLKMVSYRFVPFFACCVASSFNATIMRYKELKKGVELTDIDGKSYGISKKAGEKVITSIILSRIALQVPNVLLPPLLMFVFRSANLAPTKKIPAFLFDSLLTAVSCTIALPLATSLFPDFLKVRSSDLEEEFRDICDEHGRVMRQFIVRKGV